MVLRQISFAFFHAFLCNAFLLSSSYRPQFTWQIAYSLGTNCLWGSWGWLGYYLINTKLPSYLPGTIFEWKIWKFSFKQGQSSKTVCSLILQSWFNFWNIQIEPPKHRNCALNSILWRFFTCSNGIVAISETACCQQMFLTAFVILKGLKCSTGIR